MFICSYLASGAFTGVFEIGIDSMFLCFMEDEERNDGINHRKYSSKGLRKFMQKKEEESDKKAKKKRDIDELSLSEDSDS